MTSMRLRGDLADFAIGHRPLRDGTDGVAGLVTRGRSRGRIATAMLLVSLVGGAWGIEAAASHLSGEVPRGNRPVPAVGAPGAPHSPSTAVVRSGDGA